MNDKSKQKWALAGSWAVSLFVMQRIYGEAMKGTKRLQGLIGDVGLVQPADEKLLIPMMCMQAFAIEQLLKSIVIRGGKDAEKSHDLGKLYRNLDGCSAWPKVKDLCQREYYAWREQALALAQEAGFEKLSVEHSLGTLLEKHKDDFVKFRYAEEMEPGPENAIKDRLGMFLALCALEATRFQAIADDGNHEMKYSLTGSQGSVRNQLAERAKNLLRGFLADGGQDLSGLGTTQW